MNDLSIIILTQNSEKYITKCLNSIKNLKAELIIFDTGSQDETKTMCQGFGVKWYERALEDDLSALKNEAMRQATKSWVLMLEPQEYLTSRSCKRLKTLLESKPEAMAFSLKIVNKQGEEEVGHSSALRLFKRSGKFYYNEKGQILKSIIAGGGREAHKTIGLKIYHELPQKVETKGSSELNRLGHYDQNEKDGYDYYHLANEYARWGKDDLAKKYFLKSYQRTKTWDIGYSASLALSLTLLLYQRKEYKEAYRLVKEFISYYKDFACLYLLKAMIAYELEKEEEAVRDLGSYEFYKETSQSPYPSISLERRININQLRTDLILKKRRFFRTKSLQ